MLKHVEDVEDRSNTHKGCNAMYVKMEKYNSGYTSNYIELRIRKINSFELQQKFIQNRLRIGVTSN